MSDVVETPLVEFEAILRSNGLKLTPEETEDLRDAYDYFRAWLGRLHKDWAYSDEPALRLTLTNETSL